MEKKLEEIRIHQIAIRNIRQEIKDIIVANKLPLKEKSILIRRFVKTETLEEVGKAFGVTRERVRQIEAKALERIRQNDFSSLEEINNPKE